MDPLIPTGSPTPDFTLPALDGTLYRLSQARPKIVILNFWSAECPWAERADEQIRLGIQAWGEAVAVWPVASNTNEPLTLLSQVAGARGLLFVLRDERQQVADLYGAQTTPHVFVIDGSGILRYQGAVDDVTFRKRTPSRFYLKEAIEALLAGRNPDPAETPPYGCSIVRYE